MDKNCTFISQLLTPLPTLDPGVNILLSTVASSYDIRFGTNLELPPYSELALQSARFDFGTLWISSGGLVGATIRISLYNPNTGDAGEVQASIPGSVHTPPAFANVVQNAISAAFNQGIGPFNLNVKVTWSPEIGFSIIFTSDEVIEVGLEFEGVQNGKVLANNMGFSQGFDGDTTFTREGMRPEFVSDFVPFNNSRPNAAVDNTAHNLGLCLNIEMENVPLENRLVTPSIDQQPRLLRTIFPPHPGQRVLQWEAPILIWVPLNNSTPVNLNDIRIRVKDLNGELWSLVAPTVLSVAIRATGTADSHY